MISEALVIALCAGAVLLFFIARGYKRGILVELGRLISLALVLAALFFGLPYLNLFLPLGRTGRAAVYVLVSFVLYKLIHAAVLKIGFAVRKTPVVGWFAGVLGAIAGSVEAVILIEIVQLITGIPVTAAVSVVLEKGGF